jgi:glycosyltransferase involved in cell wall biosynthesis
VNPGRDLGGAEHNLLLLLQGLRMRGVDTAVALFGRGQLEDRLRVLDVPAHRLPVPEPLRRAGRYAPTGRMRNLGLATAGLPVVLRLAALARRVGADLVHTNGTKAHLLGGLAGRLASVPVVWHLHDFPPSGWAERVFRRAARRLPTLVIANSRATAALMQTGAVTVATIHNPVDLAKFRPDVAAARLRAQLRLDPRVALVGMAAHLTPWKGHGVFLEIARGVRAAGVEAHFVIAGGEIYETAGHAGYRAMLERRSAELQVSEHVTFLGARDDMPEFLASLDVLVHCPTAPEPFGRVLAEAMAVGRPVVAARCGGIPEVVENRVGVLVTPGDVGGFVAAVVRLLKDVPLREQMGRAGRRRAEALFDVDRHVAAVLDAYRSVLGARPTASPVSA